MKLYLKNKSKSSKKWIKNHLKDFYVKQKKIKKLRSRSWFKIQQIQNKDKIIKRNINVVEFGASPGGWSQYIIKKIGKNGSLISSDILPLKPIKKVIFLQGNVLDINFINNLLKIIKNKKINLVVSDISPNISGISEIDIPKSINLSNTVFNICKKILFTDGNFLIKILQGKGFEELLENIKTLFKKVKIRKPEASSSRSREVYIVALGRI